MIKVGDNGIVTNFLAGLLDLIYPPSCVLCGQFGVELLCDKCRATLIIPVPEPYCLRCGQTLTGSECNKCIDYPAQLIRCRSVGVYDGQLADLIHQLKYRDRPMLARPLASVMAEYLTVRAEIMNDLAFDAIVPVPLHRYRYKRRGYNQSEELAKQLGKLLSIPVEVKLIARVRNTKPQVGKHRQERLHNLEEAFMATPHKVSGKTYLLVDDVSTTGSTISECSKALTTAGARQVFALTLAAG
jgi:ComF family protein